MSLSKKNLDKLNKYKKNRNLNNDSNNISNYSKKDNSDNLTKDSLKLEDPNQIFYSLIDNSETLDETTEVNYLLRKSEMDSINTTSKGTGYSTHLTTEDELYDEFNYLLED